MRKASDPDYNEDPDLIEIDDRPIEEIFNTEYSNDEFKVFEKYNKLLSYSGETDALAYLDTLKGFERRLINELADKIRGYFSLKANDYASQSKFVKDFSEPYNLYLELAERYQEARYVVFLYERYQSQQLRKTYPDEQEIVYEYEKFKASYDPFVDADPEISKSYNINESKTNKNNLSESGSLKENDNPSDWSSYLFAKKIYEDAFIEYCKDLTEKQELSYVSFLYQLMRKQGLMWPVREKVFLDWLAKKCKIFLNDIKTGSISPRKKLEKYNDIIQSYKH